jgi:hypothetical protein
MPGKPKQICIPIKYLLKDIIKKGVIPDQKIKHLLNLRKIKVNERYVTDPKAPCALLDKISVYNKLTQKDIEFLLFLNENKGCYRIELHKDVTSYVHMVVDYIRKTDHYEVRTFRGRHFRVPIDQISKLKEPGSYIYENTLKEQEVKNITDNLALFELIKLSGKRKFERYELLSIRKIDSNYYNFKVRFENAVQKDVVMTRKQFVTKYVYKLRQGVELK